MWVLNQMDPEGAAYNMRDTMRLRGPLDRAALRRAFDRLVARHEAFRSTFDFADTEPAAFIGAVQPANVVELDLSDRPESEREREIRSHAGRTADAPFNLATGPPHRFLLMRIGADDHVLVLVMHHIVAATTGHGTSCCGNCK